MTRRARQVVEKLRPQAIGELRLAPAKVAAILLARGLRPSEAGWVLHQVLGMEMNEAVHVATLAGRDAPVGTITSDAWPPYHQAP